MRALTVVALRGVIALLLAGGTVLVVAMSVGLVTSDERVGDLPVQAFFGVMIPGFVAALAILGCVWKLLTMAAHETVFSRSAFRYVDIVVGGFTVIGALVLAFGVLLTLVNDGMAEEEQVAPGVVLMVGGVGLAFFGVALVVLVMRTLLRQATELKDELDEVI